MNLNFSSLKKLIIFSSAVGILVLYSACILNYPGSKIYYTIFTIVFNLLLVNGFLKQKFHSETFIPVFLWLGFWLKFSYHFAVGTHKFDDPTGSFDFLSESFDQVLLVSSIGALGYASGFLVMKLLKFKSTLFLSDLKPHRVPNFYLKYRWSIFGLFALVVLVVGFTNMHFGIYQRGTVPSIKPPFLIDRLYAWLLLSGFAVTTATLIYWDTVSKASIVPSVFLSMFESFVSNLSILSRGFFINPTTQIYSILIQPVNKIAKVGLAKVIFLVLAYVLFFVFSLVPVSLFRYEKYSGGDISDMSINKIEENHVLKENVQSNMSSLIINRWVGLEGVMSLVGYSEKGWPLMKEALNEKFSDSGTSFYDSKIANSIYTTYSNIDKHHFISLPGMLAFLYYPGSYTFLFIMCSLISIIFILVELFTYKITMNPFLCALLAESFAFKITHFGYAPSHSPGYYLTFIFFVVFIAVFQRIISNSKNTLT